MSADLTARARELVERTRAAQGLPPRVTDPVALSAIASTIAAATPKMARRKAAA